MNAERLHLIAISLRNDFAKLDIPAMLQRLVTALNNQVKQPNQPQHQIQVQKTRDELNKALAASAVNSYTPAWLEIVEEIGGFQFIGKNISSEIELIFNRNNISPSVVQQELTRMNERLKPYIASLNQLCIAMKSLNVSHENLAPGECEVGIVVPRSEVDNALPDFGKELVQLNQIFSVFSEIVTDSRESFKIKTISSSDLTVFLDFAPGVAACTAVAIERIVSLYKNLLEIKELRARLEREGVPKEGLDGVESHANSIMENGIQKLVEELIERYHKNPDESRKNELKVEAKFALNKLAKRIDRGYGLDVRIEPLIGDEQLDDSPENEIVNTIINASKNIHYIAPSGEPILNLPESVS